MDMLKKMFGPNREEIWKELSKDLHANFIEKVPGSRSCIEAKVGEWTVTLDTHIIHTHHDQIEFIRLRAPYLNKDGHRFSVYRGGMLDSIGKMFGLQDIETGHPEFDKPFIVQSNNEEKIKQFFASKKFRALMKAQDSLHLQVKDDDGYFSKRFPEKVDELILLSEGGASDPEKIKAIYELFAEALHQLCQIGSAYESDPNVEVS